MSSAEKILPAFTPKICDRMILYQPIAEGIPLAFVPNIIIGIRNVVFTRFTKGTWLWVSFLRYPYWPCSVFACGTTSHPQ